MKRLTVDLRPGDYVIARYGKDFPVPVDLFSAADGAVMISVTRTPDEVSVVCPEGLAPAGHGESVEGGWRLLSVRGSLAFTLTGIMASLAGSLAAAGVSLFAVSTFDTDHVLVKATDLSRAIAALRDAGHEVHGD
jgi:uncharacterized protein